MLQVCEYEFSFCCLRRLVRDQREWTGNVREFKIQVHCTVRLLHYILYRSFNEDEENMLLKIS